MRRPIRRVEHNVHIRAFVPHQPTITTPQKLGTQIDEPIGTPLPDQATHHPCLASSGHTVHHQPTRPSVAQATQTETRPTFSQRSQTRSDLEPLTAHDAESQKPTNTATATRRTCQPTPRYLLHLAPPTGGLVHIGNDPPCDERQLQLTTTNQHHDDPTHETPCSPQIPKQFVYIQTRQRPPNDEPRQHRHPTTNVRTHTTTGGRTLRHLRHDVCQRTFHTPRIPQNYPEYEHMFVNNDH